MGDLNFLQKLLDGVGGEWKSMTLLHKPSASRYAPAP